MDNKIQPFKYWTQRVLPQVYDDSLSYTELLGKVVAHLNEVTESQNETVDTSNRLLDWFNVLDVQDEINEKLDKLALDGTLDTIINHNIFNDLNTQLVQIKNKEQIITLTEIEEKRDPIAGRGYKVRSSAPLDFNLYNVAHAFLVDYEANEQADGFHHIYSAVGNFTVPYESNTHDHNELGAFFTWINSKGGADCYGGAYHVRQSTVDAKLFGHSVYLEYNHDGASKSKHGVTVLGQDLSQSGKRATVGLLIDKDRAGGGFTTGIIVRNTSSDDNYHYNEGIRVENYKNSGLRTVGMSNGYIHDIIDGASPTANIINIRDVDASSVFSVRKDGRIFAKSGLKINTNSKLTLDDGGATTVGYNENGRIEIMLVGSPAMYIQGDAVSIQGNKSLKLPNTAGGQPTQGSLRNNNGVLEFHDGTAWKTVSLV